MTSALYPYNQAELIAAQTTVSNPGAASRTSRAVAASRMHRHGAISVEDRDVLRLLEQQAFRHDGRLS